MALTQQGGASIVVCMAPAAIRTSTVTSSAVDTANAGHVLIVGNVGVITDGTHTISVTECATSGGSYTTVAASDLIGTPGALTSATPVLYQYVGKLRYLKVVSTVTGSPATGGYYDFAVVLTGSHKQS